MANDIQVAVRATSNGVESVMAGAADSIHSISAAAASVEPSLAAAGAAETKFSAIVNDSEIKFRRVRSEQEAVDKAWTEALAENAARMKAAEEEKARAAEASERRIEAARERQIHKEEELQLVALKTLKTGNIGGVVGAVGEVAGIAAAGAALEHFVDEAKDSAIELDHLSSASGDSVSSLAALQAAMAAAGAPADNIAQMVTRYARAILEAQDPTTQQARALKALGISATDANGKANDFMSAIIQLGAHMHDSTNATQDLGAASMVFGRNVVPLTGFLKDHGDELQKLIGQYSSYGQAVEGSVPAARDLTKAEAELSISFKEISAEALPYLVDGLKILYTAFSAVKEIVDIALIPVGQLMFTFLGLGRAIDDIAHGNLAAAKADFENIGKDTAAAFKQSLSEMKNDAADAWNFIHLKAKRESAPTGDTDTDYQARAGKADIQRRTQEAQLAGAEAHQLALLDVERAGSDQRVRLGEENNHQATSDLLAYNAAELAIREKFISAKIALYKNDPDSADKIAKLNADKIAAEDKAAKEEQAILAKAQEQNKFIIDRAHKELVKDSDATVKEMQRASEEEMKYQNRVFQNALKNSSEEAQQQAKAAATMLEGDDNLRIKQLKSQEEVDLARAKAKGPQAQIAVLKEYDEKIKAVINDLMRLKIEQAGGDVTKIAEAKVSGSEQIQGISEETARKQREIADQIEKSWEKATAKINSQFDQVFQRASSGSESFSRAFAKMGEHMLASVVTSTANMLLKFAEFEAKKLLLHVATTQASVAADATGAAEKKGIDLGEQFSSAKVVAANVYASVSAIPYIGWILAPPAAAAAFAAVLAFEEGGIMGDTAGLALLHPKEMVLPAPISQAVQSMATGPNQTVQGGGDLHVHYHGYAGQTPESMRSDSKQVAKHVDREMRRRNMHPVFAK